jgi:small subunit ribosomal protein S13
MAQNQNQKEEQTLVRIMQTDIPGDKNLYGGLTRIKGVSFSISNAICKNLGFEKKKKIGELTKEEIEKLNQEVKNPNVPDYMKNRQKDFDTGETTHLSISDLDLKKEFDIKRLQKIKSRRGNRHSRKLPVRGQRTKAHFRKKSTNKVVGVKKKK